MPFSQNQDLISAIVLLSKDLHFQGQDLPRAVITFKEQRFKRLKFHVVLLRILKIDSDVESLLELSKRNAEEIHFFHERAANVGVVDNKFVKEANAFTLEIPSDLFLRQNHSINLVEARQFVVNALQKMIGPFEDRTSYSRLETVMSSEKSENTLRLHLPRAAQSLDPRAGTDRTSGLVIKMLYEGLLRTNDQDEVELGLASHVTISEDKKKYIFSLKKTYWSNGSELTAYDFEYAWKKILEPDYRSPYCFLFFPIKNAEAVKRGEKPMNQAGIYAQNDKTLLVQLEHPAPYFLNLTSNWIYSPLCREIDQIHPGWAYKSGETHICNGPFKLEKWDLNDNLQIIKNPLYWDRENVKIDRIKVCIIEDSAKALNLFKANELDWFGDPLSKIPPSVLLQSKNEKLALQTDQKHFGLFWLQMNIHRLPFQNAKVRKALAFGTNRQELINTILHGRDLPAFGFSYRFPPDLPPAFKDGDEELALRLFEEGLEELKITRDELPPIVISHSEIEEQVVLSQALGAQWQRLFGIEVKYNKLLWNSYFDALNSNDLHIGGIAWYTRFPDPIYYYNLFIFREHAARITTWKSPVYNRLVEEAKQTEDPVKKERNLAEAEKILLEAMPVIPLFYQKWSYIINPRLKNYILSTTNQVDFRAAYLEG